MIETSLYGDLYVDKNGDRFTTACFAADGDPWQGALILTGSVINRLHTENLLPLTEVVRHVPREAKVARKKPWWRIW